jgi:hypothetical protein
LIFLSEKVLLVEVVKKKADLLFTNLKADLSRIEQVGFIVG